MDELKQIKGYCELSHDKYYILLDNIYGIRYGIFKDKDGDINITTNYKDLNYFDTIEEAKEFLKDNKSNILKYIIDKEYSNFKMYIVYAKPRIEYNLVPMFKLEEKEGILVWDEVM